MAALTDTDYTKLATDTGERFIDSYYSALDGARASIKSFYVPTIVQENGRGLPNITYNGEVIGDAALFQERWEKQMPRTHVEAQSVNVHVLNPTLKPTEGMKKKDVERNMSLIVQVSGSIRIGQPKEGPLRGFSDSFVLVPNSELSGGAGTGKQDHGRQWLIQSQTFRPNTDQSLNLTIFANGIACPEYTLPTSSTDDPNIVQCFVPVSEGDELTIRGTFTGSCLHGSFDILADGSFLFDRRIEGQKDGEIRHYTNRKLEFRSFYDAPKVKGHTSIFAPDKLVEGHLHVQARNAPSQTAASFPAPSEFGIGSLAVVVSLNQRNADGYTNKYKSLTCGDPDIGRKDDDDGGIPAEYELMLRPMEGELTKHKGFKHRRHAEQTRFGTKPWAKIIFYYRSQETIDEHDCIQKDGTSHALEADDAETFVCGSIEGARPKKKKGEQESPSATPGPRSSLFTSPGPEKAVQRTPAPGEQVKHTTPQRSTSNQEPEIHNGLSTPRSLPRMQRLPDTPSSSTPSKIAAQKPRLMGQSLVLPPDFVRSPLGQQHETGEQPAGDDFGMAIDEFRREQQERDFEEDQHEDQHADDVFAMEHEDEYDLAQHIEADEHLTMFSDFNARHERMSAARSLQQADDELPEALQHLNHDALIDMVAEAEVFPGGIPQPAAPTAQMVGGARETQTADAPIMQEQTVFIKEEERASPAPSHADPEPDYINTSNFSLPHHNLNDNAIATAADSDMAQTTPHNESDGEEEITTPPRCNLTPLEIFPHIPTQGIALNDLKLCFTAEQLPHGNTAATEFVNLVKQVAYQKNNKPGMYYRKPNKGSQGASPSRSQQQYQSQTTPTKVVSRSQPQLQSQTSPNKAVPQMPAVNVSAPPNEIQRAARAAERAAASQRAAASSLGGEDAFKIPKIERADTPATRKTEPSPAPTSTTSTSISRKRSAGAFTAPSRDSTPTNKKARLDEYTARKAEASRLIEEKRRRTAAALEKAEAGKRKREEMDRVIEAAHEMELAEMAAEAQFQDDEVERLERLAAEDDEAVRDQQDEYERSMELLRASAEV
ncbi:hypothetical protein LTR56_008215 [Elasticomyces elasticus]|nr:hypothetical protein LTR56_008215 [Elasticomyces elasticus]KAK3661780.1 hypothetical protein LTR22_007361 [Elasticomyces elasticus]KAK4924385.1 hypothetical protein LTR49_008474 [Elasticomyces elasticus]KAK5762651.1 hypothetical protein LTS12_007243 [Elasticomyces elasticus]